jgi:hypothetical protein
VPRCIGVKPNGNQCERIVDGSAAYCFSHDPKRKAQRSKIASKAGSTKPGTELYKAKQRIKELVEGTVEGTVDKGKASVAFQGLGILARFLELERKAREAEEFEARLAELETLAEQRKHG